MRWWLFLVAFAVTMSADAGLMPALAVGRTVPQLWPVLLAFVAMYASRESALGAAACVGIWLDATHPALGIGADAAWALQASVPYWSFAMAGPRFGNPVRIGRPGD